MPERPKELRACGHEFADEERKRKNFILLINLRKQRIFTDVKKNGVAASALRFLLSYE